MVIILSILITCFVTNCIDIVGHCQEKFDVGHSWGLKGQREITARQYTYLLLFFLSFFNFLGEKFGSLINNKAKKKHTVTVMCSCQ